MQKTLESEGLYSVTLREPSDVTVTDTDGELFAWGKGYTWFSFVVPAAGYQVDAPDFTVEKIC